MMASQQGDLDLNDLTGVWYRRVRIGENLPLDMNMQMRQVSLHECRAVFFGLIRSLDTFVLDRYDNVQNANHKQFQLQIARNVGLEIPRTLITNNPDAVKKFYSSCEKKMITKMMTSFSIGTGKDEKVVYTTPIDDEAMSDLDGLSLCPMTFQEQVPKKVELRVTIVGNKVFSAAVDSQSTDKTKDDWRRSGISLIDSWKDYPLPPEIEKKLLAFMDRLELNYGAIDIIVTPDDKYVFLEINSVGEFFWLELYNPHFPVSSAIADVLLGNSFRRKS